MIKITDILPNFATLKEYRDFLNDLVEKKADGQEIARGMDKHDKSKAQKKDNGTYVSKQVKKHASGSSVETHYDQEDPSIGQQPMEPPVPLQPGQQVNIGNKIVDPTYTTPKTIGIDVSSEKDKIELKPRIDLNNTRLS